MRTDREYETALNELLSSGAEAASLEVSLPVSFSDDENPFIAKFSVGLSCVAGLVSTHGKPSLAELLPQMPPLGMSCEESSGGVVAVGGALFGYKRDNENGRKEAAHFAARALLGSVRFDTVAISVIGMYSISEIYSKCGDDNAVCAAGYHDANDAFLSSLSAVIEDELRVLGVPQNLWSRVLLFPICRLGTDFRGYEAGGLGCRWSAFHGQWVTNEHSYTLLSPYHKWFASFDLDEFIVDDAAYMRSAPIAARRHVEPRAADSVFSRRALASGVRGAIRVPWLEFKAARGQERNITRAALRSGGLVLESSAGGPGAALNRTGCVAASGVGGKTVVSCEDGAIGMHVHDGLRVVRADDLGTRRCFKRVPFDAELVVYHGHGPRFGDCSLPRGA